MYAATRPDQTGALIVFGSAARGRLADDYPWAWTEGEWDEYLAELLAEWGSSAYARKWWAITAPAHRADKTLERWFLAYQRLSASPGVMVAIERIWHDIDVRPVLETVSVPTLVLHRSGDPIESIDAGRDFARRIPAARFVELPGDDWFVWSGDEAAVIREVESFLRDVRAQEAELDRMLAAVLFTDIVGSTARTSTIGDSKWKEMRERHDAIVRSMLARYRGVEQDNAGDGFPATFEARPVQCAVLRASSTLCARSSSTCARVSMSVKSSQWGQRSAAWQSASARASRRSPSLLRFWCRKLSETSFQARA